MNRLKQFMLAMCAFSFVVTFMTACDVSDREKDSKEYQEGDSDDSDLFTIPLDSSGPSDEKVLDRLENKEEK